MNVFDVMWANVILHAPMHSLIVTVKCFFFFFFSVLVFFATNFWCSVIDLGTPKGLWIGLSKEIMFFVFFFCFFRSSLFSHFWWWWWYLVPNCDFVMNVRQWSDITEIFIVVKFCPFSVVHFVKFTRVVDRSRTSYTERLCVYIMSVCVPLISADIRQK